MKVATYNVRVDTDYDREWSWDYRKKELLKLISYHDWQVVCIQEVRPNQVADLKTLPQYEVLAKERDGDGLGEGLAILFKPERFKLLDQGYFWLSLTPTVSSKHPQAAYKRIALWALLEERKTKEHLLIINTHLDNESERARYEGLQILLEQLADKIKRYPVLLMGDFNAPPQEKVHQLLKKDWVSAKHSQAVFNYGPQGTYQNFEYTRNWSDLEEIDYVYGKNIKLQKAGVLTDSFENQYVSDHFPLEVTISMIKGEQ